MGIIIRQSLKSTFVTYIGVLLGAVNMLILFPHFLKPDQFGLTRVLLSAAVLIAQLAEFGGGNIVVKYFPVFRDDRDTFRKFVFWILLKALTAFAIISFGVYFFRGPLLDSYMERSNLVPHFFGYIFPLAIFLLLFNLMEAYARSLLRITVPTFLREVYLRLFLLVIILLYHFDYITFDQFILWFALSYFTAMVIIGGYIFWLDRIFVKPSLAFGGHEMVGEVFVFGVFSILTSGVWKAVTQLDVLMLGDMDLLENVGVYSLCVYVVSLIQLPQRSLHLISEPIVANFMKQEQWQSAKELLKRVALTQTIAGAFLFLGIWVNLDNLIALAPEEYRMKAEAIHGAVFILMLGKLFDMANGFNGEVIHYSKYYKFNLLAGIILAGTCIGANLIFIPKFSIVGAAIATALAVAIFNIIRSLLIYVKFGFVPYSKGMLTLSAITVFVLGIVTITPDLENVYLDMALKSIMVTILFLGAIVLLKLSQDINQLIKKVINQVTSLGL